MKICAIVAEYNPLHYGHIRQIEYIKNKLKADKIVVLMSGNFTQRGEPAILDKYTRARHAILSGADLVVELPTLFATANAETFSYGAISLLNSLNIIDGICFGVESGDKKQYIELAEAMNNESRQFKKALRENLDKGFSLAKSKFEALKEAGQEYDEKLISLPNNILGLEYTKAILKLNSSIDIYPLLRENIHNDITLRRKITSAKSIRECIENGKIRKVKKNLPKYVYSTLVNPIEFDSVIITKALTTSEKDFAEILDCTEGLENRIKALLKGNLTLDKLVEKISTKRYTQARIRRILIANLLGVKRKLIEDCLDEPLYAKILAVKSASKDLIALIKEKSKTPIITRKSDVEKLEKKAKDCFNIDSLACDIYSAVTKKETNEFWTDFVE